MPHHLSRTLLVLTLLAASCDACSTGAPSGRPSTPPATHTPVPADLSIDVPKGEAADTDGTPRPSEWASAQQATLVPEGELLLMHDGQYLYLGLRGRPDNVGSVCFMHANRILVLHSSLGVGTAIYQLVEGSWQRTEDFCWIWWEENDVRVASSQKTDFLQQNGWVASTMGTGSPGEIECRIALP